MKIYDGRKLAQDSAELLAWAVDLIDIYDARLVSLGDPIDKVFTVEHQAKKIDARNVIAELRQRAAVERMTP